MSWGFQDKKVNETQSKCKRQGFYFVRNKEGFESPKASIMEYISSWKNKNAQDFLSRRERVILLMCYF